MAENNLYKSMKWSGLGEIGAKLITPVTTIILARILDPEAFGVIAICNMLITFVDIFVEAGFNKFLVQKDYKDDVEKYKYANIAFWTQTSLAVIIYLLIFCFNTQVAYILGNAAYGFVISIASLQLILVSLSSTHTALLRRNFEFKKLFIIRLVTALGPLCISVPLAIIYESYWAMIIGTLATALITTILLFILSNWTPRLMYSITILKDMWNYSFWSICEGAAHWAIWWVDIFIIGHIFTVYYIGLYKNSTHIVVSLFGMITAAMSPVLLSSLSRIKAKRSSNFVLYIVEQFFIFLLLPISVLVFCNQGLVTSILLGHKWIEAAPIIGLWSLMMSISVIIYSFPAESFKSRGIPKYLFYYQLSYLLLLIPTCLISSKFGFWEFVYVRCGCILFQVVLFMYFVTHYLNWNLKLFAKLSVTPILLNIVLFVCYYAIIQLINPNQYFGLLVALPLLFFYFWFCKKFMLKSFLRIKRVLTKNI